MSSKETTKLELVSNKTRLPFPPQLNQTPAAFLAITDQKPAITSPEISPQFDSKTATTQQPWNQPPATCSSGQHSQQREDVPLTYKKQQQKPPIPPLSPTTQQLKWSEEERGETKVITHMPTLEILKRKERQNDIWKENMSNLVRKPLKLKLWKTLWNFHSRRGMQVFAIL